jgi:hypothetical protein
MLIMVSVPERSPAGHFIARCFMNDFAKLRELFVVSGRNREITFLLFHGGAHICEIDVVESRIRALLAKVDEWYPASSEHRVDAEAFIKEIEIALLRATPHKSIPL